MNSRTPTACQLSSGSGEWVNEIISRILKLIRLQRVFRMRCGVLVASVSILMTDQIKLKILVENWI